MLSQGSSQRVCRGCIGIPKAYIGDSFFFFREIQGLGVSESCLKHCLSSVFRMQEP